MKNELLHSKSVAEMFQILKKYYDLDNCNPSLMIKQIMVNKLQQGVVALGAKPRREYA